MKKTPHSNNASSLWGKISHLKVVMYPIIVIGAVIIIVILILTFLPDPIINTFFKDKITKAVTKAYPEDSIHLGKMHYNVWKNRLTCDSIKLTTNKFTGKAASFSIRGISWIKILRQGDFTPDILSGSALDAQDIILNFHQSQNVLRFGMLHISVPDSEIVADSIKYYSLINDEQFFAKSKFRQTRYRFDIPQIQIIGSDCAAFLQGNSYNAGCININDLFVDILVNMDKPYDTNSPNPQMPNEVLSSMKEIIKVDSMIILNGRLKYSEKFTVRGTPGVITINKANVTVIGIANHTTKPDTTLIHGEALFMNSAKMKLFMAIPLTSKNFSLLYSGSISTMDVTVLNSFIEAGEYQRIKSGTLRSAKFNIIVNSGHASGTLIAEYKDLTLSKLNKDTGSEKGLFDRISTIFSKIFVIRGTNMPDENGSMKIGETNYTRNPDDYFFQFVWFALRNGVADIVGFPPI
jgi:hypothetical protein